LDPASPSLIAWQELDKISTVDFNDSDNHLVKLFVTRKDFLLITLAMFTSQSCFLAEEGLILLSPRTEGLRGRRKFANAEENQSLPSG
jgi:hypothetical protein